MGPALRQYRRRRQCRIDEVTGFHSLIENGFGLDKTGEYVFLSYLQGDSNDRVVDCIRFSGPVQHHLDRPLPDGGTYWFFLADPGTSGTANANPVSVLWSSVRLCITPGRYN